MTINIPSLVTSAGGGSSTAPTVAVTGEDVAPSSTGMTSAYETVAVQKFAGSQVITRTCSVNVNGVLGTQSNVTLLRDNTTNLGTPVSGVFLSQVPATGIGFGLKMTLFTLGLVLWSIFAAFMIARRNKVQSAVSFHTASSVDKATAFKLANYSKKVQG